MEATRDTAAETGPKIPGGARVCVQHGFYEGLELPIDAPWLVIGRGPVADWMLAEVTLSRSHAAFGWDGRRFFVQDLDSTNGTFLNGTRESEATLHDGDEVQIGKLRLRIVLSPARSMATPQSVP